MFEKPLFIINPRSSGGLDRKRLTTIEVAIKEAFPSAELRRTTHPGAAVELAAAARRDGIDLLGVVGGDGTVNETVNGLLAEPVNPGDAMPTLGLIPTGTGCDFVKSVDVPRDLDGALAVIRAGRVVRSDAVRISCLSRDDGTEIVYYFINMGGFGANGEVVDRVNRSSKRLGGFLSFASATVATTASYAGCKVRYRVDDGAPREAHLNVLMIANGQYQGGGMRTGSGSWIDDGRLKVIAIDQVGAFKLMANLGRLYSGELEDLSWTDIAEGSRVYAEPLGDDEVLIECDGEQPGKLPATYELIRGVIPVCVGPAAPAVCG